MIARISGALGSVAVGVVLVLIAGERKRKTRADAVARHITQIAEEAIAP